MGSVTMCALNISEEKVDLYVAALTVWLRKGLERIFEIY